jgi:Abnormal spindle-like microcephaly-assoc'd, ASPM-SPD-2-Hydin
MRLPRLASSRLFYCVVALVGFSAPPTAVATELKVSAEDLHFGKVIVGQTRSLSATLKNTGASAVKISSIQSSASVFVVSHGKLPFTLKAGQDVAIEIRFRPVAEGQVTGRILFDKTAASLQVYGWGVRKESAELKVSAEDLHFGYVIVGQTRSLPATLRNTGANAVKISSIQSSASVFVVSHGKLPFTLKAGQDVALEIRFRPVAEGQVAGRILFDKTAASLGVYGWGVKKASSREAVLRANPPRLTFGNVQVGNSAKLRMVLTNTGRSSISISEGKIPGTEFRLVGFSSPLTLETGQSFTFSIEFAPKISGTVGGDLTFTDRKAEAVAIMLRGTGTAAGHLGDAPAAMNFGKVTVGESASRSGTLSATEGSVSVNSVASSSPEFVVSGISFPATIAAGHSLHYTVNFTPQQSGTASASLSFASSASDSQVSESLTGSGVAAANQYVVLSWHASSSKVAGYNVYRSGQPGGPYAKINSGVNKGTTYTDTSVTPGKTYYYVIAAVNTRGQQSKYSNQAQASIP